jgi:carboxyl-terminal processing protease
MTLLRAFVLLLALAWVVPAQATASTAAPATVEDSGTQVRAFSEAYNLLLDHYVHPVDGAALLGAAWDNLNKEADGKAAVPGAAPAFTGDRPSDLQAMRDALKAYLAQPGSAQDGFVAAHALIRGMVRFVDEGHTYFLDRQQYSDYQSWSRGDDTYVGIGVSVSGRDGAPRIVEVYEDTPAQRAGLLPGDVLVRINGQSLEGMAIDEMTTLVRGPAGTDVELTVHRGSESHELTFAVQRSEIHLQFVRDRVVGDDIGYVLLRGFPEPSVVDSIEQDLTTFEAQGVHGLILDLRGNAGGRIDVGTRLLDHFLPNGSSVYQEVDRGGGSSTHSSTGANQYGLPLVVLVDGGTASMGEIFASAVQEHGVATVIGTSTAGSVAAAQVFGLPDGSGLQVTVFDILSGDGKPLNKVGVVPDEVIDPDPGTVTGGADPVLARAVEVLHQEIGATTAGSPRNP